MILRNGTAGALFDEMRAKIDPLMLDVLASSVEKRFLELVRYQIKAGGKRIRPLFAVLSCRALGGRDKDVLYAAAGLEILHNYTLIVDDIIDHSELRRGKPTLWARYGTSMAECVGIYYASAIFRAANQSRSAGEITDLFSRTLTTVMNGEILDVLYEQSGREKEPYVHLNRFKNVTPASWRKMASMKTAALFAASCETGAICARKTERYRKILAEFGYHIGIAFQIRDDALDIFGDEKDFGKTIGKDIIERKAGNLLVAYALNDLSQRKQARLSEILRAPRITDSDVREAIRLIQGTSGPTRANASAVRHLAVAKRLLVSLPDSPSRRELLELADFVVKRNI